MSFKEDVEQANNGTYLFSLGQAGYIIKSQSGQMLVIDPYLSECVERLEGHMGFKRLLPIILEPTDLQFDIVIATHDHLDHFDVDAMPELMRNQLTRLYASVDCVKLVAESGIDESRVKYVKPGDKAVSGDFYIHFVNCDHGIGALDAVGVMIEVDGKRIYEAGDTCLRLDWVDEVKKNGFLDVMIAPINGAYGNLNEAECAKLSDALSPKLTIPCHYGMFASHGGDPGKFFDVMRNNYPENDVLLMAQGERLRL